MRKKARTSFTTALMAAMCFMVLASISSPAQVKVDYDRKADFSKFKTYSWFQGRWANNPIYHAQIVQTVNSQLQSRGLQMVEQNSDLKVTYYASLDENINTTTVAYVQGLDWSRWGGGGGIYTTEVLSMPVGKMVLDVVDASENKLIWRGKAKEDFTPNQAKAKQRIASAVVKMLKSYPVKPAQ